MKKKELFDLIQQKIKVPAVELEEEYQKAIIEMKERGITEDNLEEHAIGRIHAYYKKKKKLVSNDTEVEGVIISAGGITDYGATKKYNEAKECAKTCREIYPKSDMTILLEVGLIVLVVVIVGLIIGYKKLKKGD